MKRRTFIAGLGSTAAWPVVARAQQPAVPVIGFLGASTMEAIREPFEAFRRGLAETGYVEGQNVAIEYRWAEDDYDRLPALAAELVRRQVAVIATAGNIRLALTAKAATQTIPIVFQIGANPVTSGLVKSLARPGGNITGVTNLLGDLTTKRLELLHKLVPGAASIAVLGNPANNLAGPASAAQEAALQAAAHVLGVQLLVLNATSQNEIEEAFAILDRQRAGALLLTPDPLFSSHRYQLIALGNRLRIPTFYYRREFTEAGGLISYGINPADLFLKAGVYAGRILRGEKPGDLPVQQPTRFELIINLEAAKALESLTARNMVRMSQVL
jgi:putative tryptophan/tyrosine transport system substrate-binding protein